MPRNAAARTLRILLGWLGAESPIPETDIRAIAEHRRNAGIRRVLQFLDAHDMVIPTPPAGAMPPSAPSRLASLRFLTQSAPKYVAG